jgi:hypothetical protein
LSAELPPYRSPLRSRFAGLSLLHDRSRIATGSVGGDGRHIMTTQRPASEEVVQSHLL